jgi:nitrite reductase/ring-hydroxylating ferredoxin subunit/uncharacterized membrane protein
VSLHDWAERIGKMSALDDVARPATGAVKRVVGQGPVKDLLSGTLLGHPLHPLLTDIPIGSFTSAAVLDVLGGRRGEEAADLLVALGLVSVLPTAAAGAADWSDTYGAEQRVGVVHAAANLVGVGFYAASLVARRRGSRGLGKLLGLAGMTSMSVGGYLGGHLSFSQGVGVNHAFREHPPEDWAAVLSDAELAEGKPVAVEVGGARVLLYRGRAGVFAIGATCTHAGGPLEEGSVDEGACTVTCPWHQSVFRLADGSVVHGPATVPEAAYETRVEAGRIEVRRRG